MKAKSVGFGLPHPALPGADWADCFEVTVPRSVTAGEAARQAFSQMPAWASALMAVRDVLMRPFRLKGAHDPALRRANRMGFFPVVSETDSEMVLGFDDRHLDFRIFVEARPMAAGATRVRMATLVLRHNRLGRLYITAITPFHKLIVASVMGRIR